MNKPGYRHNSQKMETCEASQVALSEQEHQGQPPDELAVSCQMTQPVTTASTLLVDVPFIHYKQTARVQEVEIPVDVTHVHVEKVEVQAPHEIPMIHPREVGVHQQIKRNNPSPVDVFTVQKYQLPRLQPKYYDVEVPIYVPRYVEVPVPSHFVALNRELLPGTLPLGPPIQSDLPTAPVLANNQVYSLAQASVPSPPHSSKRGLEPGEERFVSHPQFLVRTPEKDAEAMELACFFPAGATAAALMKGGGVPARPAFFLTPSHKQSAPAAPLDAPALLHEQNSRAATGGVRSGSNVVEAPTMTELHGLATLGRAVSSGSISGSTDRAASSICSPLVAATRIDAGAAQQQQVGAEEHHKTSMLFKEGQPPVIDTVA